MNYENIFFCVLVVVAMYHFRSMELPIIIAIGMLSGKFCSILAQLIILAPVCIYCLYMAKRYSNEMRIIYRIFILYFFVSLLVGNIYYCILHFKEIVEFFSAINIPEIIFRHGIKIFRWKVSSRVTAPNGGSFFIFQYNNMSIILQTLT